MNGLELPEDGAVVEQVGQHVEDAGLVPRVEGQIGVVPVAQYAQAAELLPLDIDPLHRLGMAKRADLGVAHRGCLAAEVFDNLVLDGQAVTVPARNIGAVETPHGQRPHDEILEHLVQGRPHVDLAVGIGRPVMQNLASPFGPGLPYLAIQVPLAPASLNLGLADGEVRLHVEPGDREVQGVFVGLGVGGHRARLIARAASIGHGSGHGLLPANFLRAHFVTRLSQGMNSAVSSRTSQRTTSAGVISSH